jgi:hypothetical protein
MLSTPEVAWTEMGFGGRVRAEAQIIPDWLT